jgi:hypothetical protein
MSSGTEVLVIFYPGSSDAVQDRGDSMYYLSAILDG